MVGNKSNANATVNFIKSLELWHNYAIDFSSIEKRHWWYQCKCVCVVVMSCKSPDTRHQILATTSNAFWLTQTNTLCRLWTRNEETYLQRPLSQTRLETIKSNFSRSPFFLPIPPAFFSFLHLYHVLYTYISLRLSHSA